MRVDSLRPQVSLVTAGRREVQPSSTWKSSGFNFATNSGDLFEQDDNLF